MNTSMILAFSGLACDDAPIVQSLVVSIMRVCDGMDGRRAAEFSMRAAAAIALCGARPGYDEQVLRRGALLMSKLAEVAREQASPDLAADRVLQ